MMLMKSVSTVYYAPSVWFSISYEGDGQFVMSGWGSHAQNRGVIYLRRQSSSDVAYSPTQFSVVCCLVDWLLIPMLETSSIFPQRAFQSCHLLNYKHIF